MLQAVCGVQMACTFVLAMLGPVGLLFAVAGDGFGMAASLVRVQRHHALCQVFNVAYLLSSVIVPLAFFGGLVGAGSPEGLRGAAKHHLTAVGVIVMGVVTTCTSIVGALAAGYVLAHPLMLHRYESVAADEESADRRSLEVRRAIDASIDDDDDELQPIDNWVAVGEPGVPLVFMPVVKPAPKPVALAPPPAAAAVVPTLAAPPNSRGARASDAVGEVEDAAAAGATTDSPPAAASGSDGGSPGVCAAARRREASSGCLGGRAASLTRRWRRRRRRSRRPRRPRRRRRKRERRRRPDDGEEEETARRPPPKTPTTTMREVRVRARARRTTATTTTNTARGGGGGGRCRRADGPARKLRAKAAAAAAAAAATAGGALQVLDRLDGELSGELSAQELIEKAKGFNRDGKYKRAVAALDEAYSISRR